MPMASPTSHFDLPLLSSSRSPRSWPARRLVVVISVVRPPHQQWQSPSSNRALPVEALSALSPFSCPHQLLRLPLAVKGGKGAAAPPRECWGARERSCHHRPLTIHFSSSSSSSTDAGKGVGSRWGCCNSLVVVLCLCGQRRPCDYDRRGKFDGCRMRSACCCCCVCCVVLCINVINIVYNVVATVLLDIYITQHQQQQ